MAKQQSLAAQAGAVSSGQLTLPGVFSAPQEKVKARHIAPYVTFAHPRRADEWNKLMGKFGKVEEGDMFLIRQDGLLALPVANMSCLCAKQYWAEANPAGEVQRTSYTELPKPFKEHIEAVVLVYLDDEIVPANVQFRTTKCGAGKALADALVDAADPSWADKTPAHKETLICQQPWMRFFVSVTLGEKRISKTSGLPYKPTQTVTRPTGVAEWRLLKAFCDGENTQKQLNDAAARYQQRLEEVDKKLVKS